MGYDHVRLQRIRMCCGVLFVCFGGGGGLLDKVQKIPLSLLGLEYFWGGYNHGTSSSSEGLRALPTPKPFTSPPFPFLADFMPEFLLLFTNLTCKLDLIPLA